MGPVIPPPDVMPLPGPAGLFEALLLFTFVLHLAAMNFTLGGSLLAALSHLRSGRDPRHARLAGRIFERLPVSIAFTVTLGVAPLLFVQVLYGQFLYSSSILMARDWFGVVPIVILAYYLVYLLRFKWDALAGLRGGLIWTVAILFAAVGFIYSNNFSLMLRPDTWEAHYFASPATGSLNWSDPALYPRYLHMLLGAVAVAGVWIMLLGARRRSGDVEWSDWAVRHGAKMFLHATLLNVLVGVWFLAALPRRVMRVFMGGQTAPTVLLVAALLLVALAWLVIRRASRAGDPRRGAFAGAGLMLSVIALMALIRQQVRAAYLAPYFSLDELTVVPQWGAFWMFAVTLVVGLAVLAWLVRVGSRASQTT